MWIKICGIRDVETAKAIAGLGAQAIGLNFYRPSPRFVAIPQARQIVEAIPQATLPVGLFVNSSVTEIRQICSECGLSTIQLHGDEPPEMLAELAEFRVIRAFRVASQPESPGSSQMLAGVDGYLARCKELNASPWGCLIDAAVPGHYGGSGNVVDWNTLATTYDTKNAPPLILAGGLTVQNVAQAIETVQPWGVDVASGVELTRGIKDLRLVEQFIAETRRSCA